MSGNALLFILFFIGCIGFGVLWEIYRRRCPQCKKFFAREVVHSAASYGSDLRHGMRKTTVSDCKCKYCGHTWTQRYTSKNRHR